MSSRARLRSAAALAILCVTSAGAGAAQLVPPSTGGLVELDRLLQRLTEPRRLLVIGAHPDDEDTEILALAALRYGADAAYLSLSRGEGGQNLIGPELGEALGLLRSQELLAARATDGARQFFTRAYDFGFTRSLEETSRFWPPDTLLKDAVRVVRRFRPHVIVSVFTGTPRDGHGQHQAAGVIARQVFAAAGDAGVYPELAQEGLSPWTPLRLYRSTRFDDAHTTVTLSTGELEWRAGRSFHQIAMASRSHHRSQDMGQLQPIGPQTATLQLLDARGDNAGEPDGLFQGVPHPRDWVTRFADSLRSRLNPARLSDAAPALAAAVARLDRENVPDEARVRSLLEQALVVSAGLVLDARADRADVAPGQRVAVVTELFNGGPYDVTLDTVELDAPRWGERPLVTEAARPVAPGSLHRTEFNVAPPQRPRGASTTQPYFLERPRVGALYDWSATPARVRGLPFEPPVLTARATVRLRGARVTLSREVTYRTEDQALGEVRRPLRVVPPVEVRLEPAVVVWPAEGESVRNFTVTLGSRADDLAGDVRLETAPWDPPPAQPFRLQRAGEVLRLTFSVRRPAGARADSLTLRAVARLDGTELDAAVTLVDYEHVRPTPYVERAVAAVRVAPIALPAVRRVGYIRGASDLVPEALLQVGLPLVLIGPDDLARGDLARFDAIVVGTRAYEVDQALTRHNDRLLAYVEQGGLLLVQYQQYAFVSGRYAPFSITINRPHDRVTDETAPVTLLVSDHPAFTRPNRLTVADWEGWPQERGLYFAGSWDPAFTPLLEMRDPGLPPVRGALLVARHGRGTYVYTGLAFFRALPAGVPGAYRLFLNLLDLGG